LVGDYAAEGGRRRRLIHHTDTTVVERLLVERSTPLTTLHLPPSSDLFSLYSEGLDSAATSHDPLVNELHAAADVAEALVDLADHAMRIDGSLAA